MSLKRVFAYLIDIFIVAIVSSAIFTTIFKDQARESEKLGTKLINYVTNTGSTGLEQNSPEYQELTYDYLRLSSTNTIINLSLQIIYFIFFQFFFNGQTLGKKLFKLRVKPVKGKKLNPSLFVLRELILLSLPIKIIDAILLFTLKQNMYLKINPILSNLTLVLYLVIIGSLIFRNDERALHDLVGQTKVELAEKKE